MQKLLICLQELIPLHGITSCRQQEQIYMSGKLLAGGRNKFTCLENLSPME
jgi:hypothetical protein